jgi:hypothetical protein
VADPEDTYRAALVRAAVLLGGARALCDRLHVPMSDLTHWLAGDGKPSIGVFLKVIDIIIDEDTKPRRLDASNDDGKPIRLVK